MKTSISRTEADGPTILLEEIECAYCGKTWLVHPFSRSDFGEICTDCRRERAASFERCDKHQRFRLDFGRFAGLHPGGPMEPNKPKISYLDLLAQLSKQTGRRIKDIGELSSGECETAIRWLRDYVPLIAAAA